MVVYSLGIQLQSGIVYNLGIQSIVLVDLQSGNTVLQEGVRSSKHSLIQSYSVVQFIVWCTLHADNRE